MSTEYVKICDKCKKKIEDDKGCWASGQPYTACSDIKQKLLNQLFVTTITLSLQCENEFDLCLNCGWEYIYKQIGFKKNKKGKWHET